MGAVKKSKIKSVTLGVSDKKRSQNLADQIASTHLRFVERQMNDLGLTLESKIIVLDRIIANIKAQTNG